MSRVQKLALLVGFLAVTTAIAVARGTPPTGYELDIYAATPTAFWVGVAVALVMALAVGLVADPDSARLRQGALVLGGLAGWTIPAVPVLRGYFFYGSGDSLSHLGFATAFLAGKTPADILHPGIHLLSLALSEAAAVPVRRAMLLVVTLFFALFLVFVPLCVREFAGDRAGLAVGTFAGVLLLHINNIGIHVIFHPSSEAVMFVPLVLFSVVLFLRRGTDDRWGTAAGLLVGMVSFAMVLIHPQEALEVLVLFGCITLLQQVYVRVTSKGSGPVFSPITAHRSLVIPTAFLAAWWLVWSPRSPRVQERLRIGYQSLFGAAPVPGAEVTTRTSLLPQLGGSVEELFVKLFLGGLVFSVIAGIAMLVSVAGVVEDLRPGRLGLVSRLAPAPDERNGLTAYVAVALPPLLAVTAFFFFGAYGDHFLRFVGFLMMLVTIVGGAALARGLSRRGSGGGPSLARVAVAVLIVALLPLAALTVHPSPWIYQPTDQVTEQQFQGYRISFEHRDPEVPYTGIRGGPRRYVEAMNDPQGPTTQQFPGLRSEIRPEVFMTNLSTYYDDPRYVPVTEADVQRDVGLYDGLRYGSAGFRTLRSTPGIHRVQANEEFRLYLLGDE